MMAQASVLVALIFVAAGLPAATIFGARRLLERRAPKFRGARAIFVVIAVLAAIPLAALALIFGGNFGGAYGAHVAERLGLADAAPLIALGIVVGMGLVFCVLQAVIVVAANRLLFVKQPVEG